jgi:general secretion pathway protein I
MSRARRSGIRQPLRAFTLLEVMVAVAVLGLGLVVILTAQTGLFSSSKRAARLSQAVGLARCKMSEIEEELLRKGYQLTKDDEEGPCCEDETSDLRCRWSVIPVTLPDLAMNGSGADAGSEGAFGGGAGSSGMGAGLNPLDAIGAAKDKLAQGNTNDALSGLSGMLNGPSAAAGPSMGAGALAPLAMGMVYPQLKGMLEASIRKVTVKVVWMEGHIERDLSVTQYLTNPQQGGLLAVDENAGAAGAGGVATPPASGTSAVKK